MKTCINLSCAFPRSFKRIFINSLRKKEKRERENEEISKNSSSLPSSLSQLLSTGLFSTFTSVNDSHQSCWVISMWSWRKNSIQQPWLMVRRRIYCNLQFSQQKPLVWVGTWCKTSFLINFNCWSLEHTQIMRKRTFLLS